MEHTAHPMLCPNDAGADAGQEKVLCDLEQNTLCSRDPPCNNFTCSRWHVTLEPIAECVHGDSVGRMTVPHHIPVLMGVYAFPFTVPATSRPCAEFIDTAAERFLAPEASPKHHCALAT